MSATGRHRIEINLRQDLGADTRPEAPGTVTLNIEYGSDGRRTVTIEHGAEEWILEFEEGECVDREPAARRPPKWLGDALEMVKEELQ